MRIQITANWPTGLTLLLKYKPLDNVPIRVKVPATPTQAISHTQSTVEDQTKIVTIEIIQKMTRMVFRKFVVFRAH